MNIIDFLEKDHDRLRRELVRVKNSLSQGGVLEEIKTYIVMQELHESIEDEILFAKVNQISERVSSIDALITNKQVHKKIGSHLNRLLESLKTNRFATIQHVFFEFCALVETHMEHEEFLIFPYVKSLLSNETLEELGEKAQSRMERSDVLQP